MFKQHAAFTSEVRPAMRGGDGSVEMGSPARMYSRLVLRPGCSIGWHVHENEEEIFYILAGQARIDDNGTEVIASVGDSVITRSGEGHSVACEGTDTLEILACIIRYVNE